MRHAEIVIYNPSCTFLCDSGEETIIIQLCMRSTECECETPGHIHNLGQTMTLLSQHILLSCLNQDISRCSFMYTVQPLLV